MSAESFRKKRARCITAKSSAARSTAWRRRRKPRNWPRKASNSTRCRRCRTRETSEWRMVTTRYSLLSTRYSQFTLIRPHQKGDANHHQHDAEAFARAGRLFEDEAGHALREQHLDERQRAHVSGAGDGEAKEPELGSEGAHEA